MVFIIVAYTGMTVSSIYVGSGIGLHFYFAVAGAIVVLVLGIDRIVLASFLAVLGAVTVIALEMSVPHDTGTQPGWAFKMGFIINTAAAWVLVVATVWYALREVARAERAMETEYQRSETLLVNILPASIAQRLKEPGAQHHCRQV